MDNQSRIYGGKNPRHIPAYTIGDAARILKIPAVTLRSWVFGRTYQASGQIRRTLPLVETPNGDALLSFVNLVEAYVLSAIRREHHIPLPKVRTSLDYLKKRVPSPNPLADHDFQTDGFDLFVDIFGDLVNTSRGGQIAMREVLENYLRRIERNRLGEAIRFFPLTTPNNIDAGSRRRLIAVDPLISFGRPFVKSTGTPTEIIAERYFAGDSVAEITLDYGCTQEEAEEAIRCEQRAA